MGVFAKSGRDSIERHRPPFPKVSLKKECDAQRHETFRVDLRCEPARDAIGWLNPVGACGIQELPEAILAIAPFVGRHVALLLDPPRSVESAIVDRVLSAIDRAWDWYYGFFGRMPQPLYVHAGKTTIADVAKTCGAACGMLGATGIELTSWSMDFLLKAAAQGRYDQAVFYELGRNFFFFEGTLGRIGAFVTGFAHVHRFHAMDACSLIGAAWDGKHDFQDYRDAMLVKLLDTYQADNALTWTSTLAANKCPPNKYGWSTADFLAAAFFEKIFPRILWPTQNLS